MNQDYIRQLIKGHRIEVNGEATYAAAARRAAAAEQRAKWRTLERLETQTKRELADILARGGVPVRERTLDVRLGQMVGAVVAALPVRLMLRGLGVVPAHS